VTITDYHAKYYAYELSRSGGEGIDRIGRTLFDATVDLNPHQIEAALFALRSPISKGVLLADEVGLGKTIEAGLVMCQYWAEKKRRILVITPASLRKQWEQELQEKFNLPAVILDAKTYKEATKSFSNPFDNSQHIIICSMHFAAGHATEIQVVPWNLITIDEAHKLRNAYRQSNKIGQQIRRITEGRCKLLLTATPLQNSLVELYGLSTLIDEYLFGDLPSFRTQYMNAGGDTQGLRDRLRYFSWRTLRSQVAEYVKYTERKLITRPFKPSEQEHELYNTVSRYLQRDGLYALPSGQKHLLILIVRKVLASSPRALAGTLTMMRDRLLAMRKEYLASQSVGQYIITANELDDDILDEIMENDEDRLADDDENEVQESDDSIDLKALEAEISELESYIRWADSIGIDTKSRALLKALDLGFAQMAEMGAARKAVIFTESRRTQAWLKSFLEEQGYLDRVITFNGTNKDDESGQIYSRWLEKNKNNGRVSGSKQIDLRAAIIDNFRDEASIMITTEAGAEGLNLQFASLVVNFDLPWNPQRIEQRIGRCHRYGQKHDVVVINFLNERNSADQRVYELLEQKFNLFSGIFGASDEVLGVIESGVDFERRILDIYQSCRSEAEIQEAFAHLQQELDVQIQVRMKETRRLLLEHFDADVHERFRNGLAETRHTLDKIGYLFWNLTKYILADRARFSDEVLSFDLQESPAPHISVGVYRLISKSDSEAEDAILYRLSHPLGDYVIKSGREQSTENMHIVFDISSHPVRISVIEQLKGHSGWLALQHLTIQSFESAEYLLFSAFDEQTQANLDQETCEKLFNVSASVNGEARPGAAVKKRLKADMQQYVSATINRNLEENSRHFNEARDQLDKWADDMDQAAQKELDDIKRRIRETQRQSRQVATIEEQQLVQQDLVNLQRQKRELRQRIFDLEDEISEKRDKLVDSLEKRMQQRTSVENLFMIRWEVV
jgi:hypothetical protein